MSGDRSSSNADGQGNPTVRRFQDLIAWQRARTLVKEVYAITRTFPNDERFGLTNQMRRAAVSVVSNIAEGFARGSRPDYIRHLRIARGSLAELETQFIVAGDLDFLKHNEILEEQIRGVGRVLQGLIAALERGRSASE